MKDKHIHIPTDSALLKKIVKSIHQELEVNPIKNARKLFFKLIFYVLASVIFYSLILWAKHPLQIFVSYILFGFSALLLAFNFAHDLSHNAVFKRKKLNNLFYTIIYTLVGAHAEAWKCRHVHSHHYAPNVKDYDADLQITSLIRVEPSAQRKWFHRFQHIYAPVAYSSYSLYWVFIKDFYIYIEDIFKESLSLTYHLSFWLQKSIYLTYLLIIPILVSQVSVSMILLAFLVMHLCQSVFLLFTFFITHHVGSTVYFETDERGYIQTSWVNNQLQSSNDFYPFSELANFIFGGFNNHMAHHLFPHINHINYPRLNKILYRILAEHNYQPNRTTFLGGVIAHLRHLKQMGIS